MNTSTLAESGFIGSEFPTLLTYDNCIEPVMKIGFNGELLYANTRAVEMLRKSGGLHSEKFLSSLKNKYPGILDPACSMDIHILVDQTEYHLSVVAFKEAGYVGFYGYRTESVAESEAAA